MFLYERGMALISEQESANKPLFWTQISTTCMTDTYTTILDAEKEVHSLAA